MSIYERIDEYKKMASMVVFDILDTEEQTISEMKHVFEARQLDALDDIKEYFKYKNAKSTDKTTSRA